MNFPLEGQARVREPHLRTCVRPPDRTAVISHADRDLNIALFVWCYFYRWVWSHKLKAARQTRPTLGRQYQPSSNHLPVWSVVQQWINFSPSLDKLHAYLRGRVRITLVQVRRNVLQGRITNSIPVSRILPRTC